MTTEQNQVAIVPPAERAALALNSSQTEIELRAMVESSADITAVLNHDAREQAHRIAMTLRTARTTIEKTGKAARDDATKFGKAVIAEQDRLVSIISPEETRILALRDGWDAEQERIQAEKIAAERRRMETHEGGLAAIARMPADVIGKTAAEIMAVRDYAAASEPGDEWEEYRDRAAAAYAEAVTQLEAMYSATLAAEEEAQRQREAQEAERQRLAAEQLALAAQRAEQEAQRQELARQQAEIAAQREAAAAFAREVEEARQREVAAQEQRALAQAAARKREDDERAAELKRQMDELAAARAALEAEKLAASEANQREHDHADALKENAERDAERLARDQEEAIDENALRKATALSEAQAAFDLAVAAAEVDAAKVADKLIATTAAHLQLPHAEPDDLAVIAAVSEAFDLSAEDALALICRVAVGSMEAA